MSVSPVPSFLKRAISRRSTIRLVRPSPHPAWPGGEGLHRVEVVAPDPECAALFLAYASPLFPAAIAPGAPATVHLHPPIADTGWVVELLAVVERWLEAARLPCANLIYGGRDYLIRSSNHLEDFVAVPSPTGTVE